MPVSESRRTIRADWLKVNQQITKTDTSYGRNMVIGACGCFTSLAAAMFMPISLPTVATAVVLGSGVVGAIGILRAVENYLRLEKLDSKRSVLRERLGRRSPQGKPFNHSFG